MFTESHGFSLLALQVRSANDDIIGVVAADFILSDLERLLFDPKDGFDKRLSVVYVVDEDGDLVVESIPVSNMTQSTQSNVSNASSLLIKAVDANATIIRTVAQFFQVPASMVAFFQSAQSVALGERR